LVKQGRYGIENSNIDPVGDEEEHVVAVGEELLYGLQEVGVETGAEVSGRRRRCGRCRFED
jgi:hypothetical protein